jgi:methylglutaconyl-CoA hydratase
MKRTAHYTEAENFADARRLAELLATIDRLGKPTIARVHGAVYGGGTGLVAACDMAVAANDASFSFSEARLGLLPATISPYVLRAIGPRLARRYFLTGERFSAGEAYRMQLVSEVCPDDELDDTIHDILQAILACGPQAQVACKKLVADIAGRPIDDLLSDDTARRIAALRASDEGKEGITAFLGKRKPIWAA